MSVDREKYSIRKHHVTFFTSNYKLTFYKSTEYFFNTSNRILSKEIISIQVDNMHIYFKLGRVLNSVFNGLRCKSLKISK